MISSRTFCDSARAIETICCAGGPQLAHACARGDVLVAEAPSSSRRLAPHRVAVEQRAAAVLVAEEDRVGDA